VSNGEEGSLSKESSTESGKYPKSEPILPSLSHSLSIATLGSGLGGGSSEEVVDRFHEKVQDWYERFPVIDRDNTLAFLYASFPGGLGFSSRRGILGVTAAIYEISLKQFASRLATELNDLYARDFEGKVQLPKPEPPRDAAPRLTGRPTLEQARGTTTEREPVLVSREVGKWEAREREIRRKTPEEAREEEFRIRDVIGLTLFVMLILLAIVWEPARLLLFLFLLLVLSIVFLVASFVLLILSLVFSPVGLIVFLILALAYYVIAIRLARDED
jgi:hypothetical protein